MGRLLAGFVIAATVISARAEQSLQSMDTLDHPDMAMETADITSTASDEIETVIIEEAPEQTGQTPASSLPVVGYVPGYDPDATHFHLTTDTVSPAKKPYLDAVAAEKAHEYERALKSIRETLTLEPTHSRAQLAEGRLLVKTGQYESAELVLRALLAERTDHWQPWFWLGTAALLKGDLGAAEGALDEALNRNSDVAEVWIHRALVAQERLDWRSAMQMLRIAAEIAPDHPMVMLNVGVVSDALGYSDSARVAYRKFLTQAHRGKVSNVLRFEVINHLGAGRVVDVVEPDTTEDVQILHVDDEG